MGCIFAFEYPHTPIFSGVTSARQAVRTEATSSSSDSVAGLGDGGGGGYGVLMVSDCIGAEDVFALEKVCVCLFLCSFGIFLHCSFSSCIFVDWCLASFVFCDMYAHRIVDLFTHLNFVQAVTPSRSTSGRRRFAPTIPLTHSFFSFRPCKCERLTNSRACEIPLRLSHSWGACTRS